LKKLNKFMPFEDHKNSSIDSFIIILSFLMFFLIIGVLFILGYSLKKDEDEKENKTKIQIEQFEHYGIKETTDKVGIASWYDYNLAEQEWSKNHFTAASRDLKRYSYAKITNLANDKSVVVFINDYIEHPLRDIDLSSYAFSQIADLKIGLIKVKIEALK